MKALLFCTQEICILPSAKTKKMPQNYRWSIVFRCQKLIQVYVAMDFCWQYSCQAQVADSLALPSILSRLAADQSQSMSSVLSVSNCNCMADLATKSSRSRIAASGSVYFVIR